MPERYRDHDGWMEEANDEAAEQAERRRDGYGRCSQCGGPFADGSDHTSTCRYRREWRPLLNGEYPPPGPTRTGRMIEKDGLMVAPIFVYAEVTS